MEEAAPKDESSPALTTIRDSLKPIVDAICACPFVAGAGLWWRLGADEGIVQGTDSSTRSADTIAAVARGLELLDRPSNRHTPFVLESSEVRALSNGTPHLIDSGISACARAGVIGAAEVRAVLLIAKSMHRDEATAVAELGWRAAACVLAAHEKEHSRAFWRRRAAEAAGECSRVRAEADAAQSHARAELAAVRAELADQRALSSKLALRMFTAADEERARIARDLHDDQAQLIAAAAIALKSRKAPARDLFKRASEELRRSIRTLKSAALGERTLEQALREQFILLSEAGIAPRLSFGTGAKRMSRTAQMLCWQVAREALANVVRHSGASRVRVSVTRSDGFTALSISDNGCGFAPAAIRAGTGLDGLRQRVELLGGDMKVESVRGRTSLMVQIPELT